MSVADRSSAILPACAMRDELLLSVICMTPVTPMVFPFSSSWKGIKSLLEAPKQMGRLGSGRLGATSVCDKLVSLYIMMASVVYLV